MAGKQRNIIIGVLVVVLGALAFYFMYWTKTPEYSLNLAIEAARKHNTEQFERHVDLDSLLNKGYDDFVAYYLNTEGKGMGGFQALAAGAAQLMKPSIVASLKSDMLKSISEDKKTDAPADTGKQDKTKQQVAVFNDNANRIYNKNVELKGIKTESQEPGVSIATIAMHNNELEKDFDIKLKMNKLENGQWRVKEITNLIPLLDIIKEAELEKSRKVDAPIKENIYKHVRGYCPNAGITGRQGWLSSFKMHATMVLKNISDKEVKNIKFYGFLYDGDGNFVRSIPFDIVKSLAPQKEYTAKTEFKLNEFDEADKKIMTEDISNYAVNICIMSLETSDGTKLERPKEASTGQLYPDSGKKFIKLIREQNNKK